MRVSHGVQFLNPSSAAGYGAALRGIVPPCSGVAGCGGDGRGRGRALRLGVSALREAGWVIPVSAPSACASRTLFLPTLGCVVPQPAEPPAPSRGRNPAPSACVLSGISAGTELCRAAGAWGAGRAPRTEAPGKPAMGKRFGARGWGVRSPPADFLMPHSDAMARVPRHHPSNSQAQLQSPFATRACEGVGFLAGLHPFHVGRRAACFTAGFGSVCGVAAGSLPGAAAGVGSQRWCGKGSFITRAGAGPARY